MPGQPSGWLLDLTGGATVDRDATVVFSGLASLKYRNPDNASNGGWHGIQTKDSNLGTFCLPLRPGTAYRVKIASRVSSVASGPIKFRVFFYHNVAGTLSSSKEFTYAAANTWYVEEFFFVVPATAEPNSTAYVQFNRNGQSGTYDFWLDSYRVQEEVPETVAGRLRRDSPFNDTKYALKGATSTGVLADPTVQLDPGNGIKEGGVVFKLYRHREEITVQGADADGDVAVSFAQTYQAVPLIFFRGGQYLSYSSTFGSGVNQRQRFQALNATTSGFTSRTQLVNAGVVTNQTDDFASGNLVDAGGETAEVNLDPAGANDDTYTVHYFVSVTLTNPGVDPNIDLTVAIETNDGSSWVERATFVYSRSSEGTSSWSHEAKAIVVTGLGLNDDIRLRAKSFIVHDAPGSSFIVRGGDAGGSNPETYNGVTYTTASDTTASAIPNNGDQVIWVAQEVV